MNGLQKRWWEEPDGTHTPTLSLAVGLHEFPGTKGVCVGSCVEGRTNWSASSAHAHIAGPLRGWVCIESPNDAWLTHGKELNPLFLHEVAHLQVPQDDVHGVLWARRALALGAGSEHVNEQLDAARELLAQPLPTFQRLFLFVWTMACLLAPPVAFAVLFVYR